MSRIVVTDLGRFNLVEPGSTAARWMFECPRCKGWQYLNEGQFNGRQSVMCAWGAAAVIRGARGCGYQETHNYQAVLRSVIVVRQINGEPVFDEGQEARS